MNIQGLQKLTLLDYPGKMACTVFTAGCNLRCPFCHNSRLVINHENQSEYTDEEIFSFLKKRSGILDGVAITGGEPLLQNDIEDFIRRVKDLGYAVKLDTNGTFPEKLRDLVEKGLIEESGRLDLPGKPIAYRTTPLFLRSFGLESLEDMPPISDEAEPEVKMPSSELEDQQSLFDNEN